jgi:hypothetical protein
MKEKVSKIASTPARIIMIGAKKYSIFPAHPAEAKVIGDARLIVERQVNEKKCHKSPS